MASGGRQPVPTDLAPGIAAAGAFLLFVFGMSMPVWLGALLAALTYGGLWLFLRDRRPAPRPLSEAQLLHSLGELQNGIRNSDIRRRAAQTWDRAARLHQYFEANPEQEPAWRGIYRETLEATLAHLRRYVELERLFGDEAHPAIGKMEELLDEVSNTFAQLRQRLVDQDAAGFETDVQLLRNTLQAVNEVNLVTLKGGRE